MTQYVIKRNGDIEPYSEEKVIHSMNRVGVPPEIQPEVLAHIRTKFKRDYLSTDDLFSNVFSYLRKVDKKASLRLNLRRAIQDLGPTGFPFEKYVARIFQSQGYKTLVGQHMQGECIMHEVDVVLEKDGKRSIVEAKFHNETGIITDVHVALYTYARFLDLKAEHNISDVWLITNTKLSLDAAHYAMCKGIKVLAWNYPTKESLQHFVEKPQMYPITILTELSHEEKQILIEDNLLLCSDLLKLTPTEVDNFPLVKKNRLHRAIESAKVLLSE